MPGSSPQDVLFLSFRVFFYNLPLEHRSPLPATGIFSAVPFLPSSPLRFCIRRPTGPVKPLADGFSVLPSSSSRTRESFVSLVLKRWSAHRRGYPNPPPWFFSPLFLPPGKFHNRFEKGGNRHAPYYVVRPFLRHHLFFPYPNGICLGGRQSNDSFCFSANLFRSTLFVRVLNRNFP